LRRGSIISKAAVYLLVEQVLEIIFTLFTVKVDWVPAAPALLPEVLEPEVLLPEVPEPGLVELGLEELGLLEPEADELLSLPMRRT